MLGKFAVEVGVLDEQIVLDLQFFLLLLGDLFGRYVAEKTRHVDKYTMLGKLHLGVLDHCFIQQSLDLQHVLHVLVHFKLVL